MSVVMAVIAVNVYNVLSHSKDGTKKIKASIAKMDQLQKTAIAMINAETSVRGYIISGKDDYLKSYNISISQINGPINPSGLYALMPNHVLQVKELNDYIQREKKYLQQIITYSKQPLSKDNNIDILHSEGNYAMDNIRIIISNLYNSESRTLNLLNVEQEEGISNVVVILLSGLLICLVLLLIFYFMVAKNTSIRNKVEKDLLTAKQYAEEASSTKTQFLSTVSHGIRNPLNGVVGNTSLLNQTNLNIEQKKYAQNIQRSSITLLSIVNDILDFSKIESGTLELENLPFVLSHCIEEVFSLTGTADKDIRMSYAIDPNIPVLIIGDMGRLWQILINILGNTLDNFSKGVISLNAKLEQVKGNEIVIAFSITGSGNHSEKTPSIYNYKDKLQTGKQHTSTGLGLSITSRIIALMGGTIKVSNQGDKALITSFTIKTKTISDETEQISIKREDVSEKVDNDMSAKLPMRILIADDNEMSQVLLSSILLTMGYSCDIATNGTEAVAMAIEEQHDLIFMDIFMPEMDGIEATQKLRKYYMNKEFPIIVAVTANVLFTEKEKCFAAGMNDFLTKPFNPKHLQNLIVKWGNIKEMLEV